MTAAAERRSGDEPVAEPAHRKEMFGLVRITFDLLADTLHVHVERLGVADVVVTPDPLDKELPGEQAARRPKERLEQLELLRRERDRGALDDHLVAVDVHPDRAAHEDVVGGHRLREVRPAQMRSDPRHQLPHRERLGHIIVCAELQTRHLVGLRVLRRHDDDRDHRLLPDDAHDIEPWELRQHQIQDHEVGVGVVEPFDRTPPVLRDGDRVPLSLERIPDRLGERLLVLDEQDPPRRSAHSWTSCEASVNSRNSPVIRNPTCSAMSTAWSPTRSSARETRFMCNPQSSADGSSASLSASKWLARFNRSTGASIFGSCRVRSRSRRSNASIAVRSIRTTRSRISRIWPRIVSLPGRSSVNRCSLAMLTAWSPVRSRSRFTWMIAETSRRSAATGVWSASVCSVR